MDAVSLPWPGRAFFARAVAANMAATMRRGNKPVRRAAMKYAREGAMRRARQGRARIVFHVRRAGRRW
jgi:hypothetical protein